MIFFLIKKAKISKLNLWADGDSLTAQAIYPDDLFDKFSGINDKFLTNTGVGGQTSANLLSDFSTHLNNIYLSEYVNILSLMIGTNDIYHSVSTSTTMSNIITAVTAAKNKGFRVSVNTIPPFFTLGHTQDEFNTWYNDGLALNTLIRNNAIQYGYIVCDIANNAKYDYQDAVYDTTVYTVDQVHQNSAGYQLFADIVYNTWITNKFVKV
jgi:lysophospholipase L1-like esterase